MKASRISWAGHFTVGLNLSPSFLIEPRPTVASVHETTQHDVYFKGYCSTGVAVRQAPHPLQWSWRHISSCGGLVVTSDQLTTLTGQGGGNAHDFFDWFCPESQSAVFFLHIFSSSFLYVVFGTRHRHSFDIQWPLGRQALAVFGNRLWLHVMLKFPWHAKSPAHRPDNDSPMYPVT